MPDAKPLNPIEANDYLKRQHGVSRTPATLAKLRCIGGGPPWRRVGRNIVYTAADLDNYAAGLTSERFTATAQYR